MVQVPDYRPVPSTSPTEQGAPSIREDTPPAAFGANIAAATERAGSEVAGAGTELFNRAIALQQLNNETGAKNANIQFMIEAGQLHAQYNSLQGNARVAAYPKYSADLQALYQKHRGSLSNPMAQRMFDSSAVSVMNRSIFSGAAAAGDAQREGALTAANAEFDINTKNVNTNPEDEGVFNEAIQRNHANAGQRAALMPGGYSPQVEQDIIKKGDSTLAYGRIVGMARTNPDAAYSLWQKYSDQGLLFGNQAVQAEQHVLAAIHTTGMDGIAGGILAKYKQPDGSFSKSFADMQQEAREAAAKKYPEDPQAATFGATALDRNYNQIRWGQVQDQRATTSALNDQIVKGVTTLDGLPLSLRNQMTPMQIKQFPADVNAYRNSQEKQTNYDAYTRLLGLYNNDNGKFMDTNIYQVPGLSKGNIDFFVGLQRKAEANGDPRVAKALATLRGAVPEQLQELNIYRRSNDNMGDYDKFVGTLHSAIQAYQEDTGKPPDEKTLTKEIFPNVIRQTTSPGWIWNSSVPLYNAPLPQDIRDQYEKSIGHELSTLEEQQVRQEYLRTQFKKLFAGAPKSPEKDQSKAPAGPQVPQSQ